MKPGWWRRREAAAGGGVGHVMVTLLSATVYHRRLLKQPYTRTACPGIRAPPSQQHEGLTLLSVICLRMVAARCYSS